MKGNDESWWLKTCLQINFLSTLTFHTPFLNVSRLHGAENIKWYVLVLQMHKGGYMQMPRMTILSRHFVVRWYLKDTLLFFVCREHGLVFPTLDLASRALDIKSSSRRSISSARIRISNARLSISSARLSILSFRLSISSSTQYLDLST